jgi:hypothetical protein
MSVPAAHEWKQSQYSLTCWKRGLLAVLSIGRQVNAWNLLKGFSGRGWGRLVHVWRVALLCWMRSWVHRRRRIAVREAIVRLRVVVRHAVMQLELYASLYHGRACRQHIRQQGQRGTRDKRQRR